MSHTSTLHHRGEGNREEICGVGTIGTIIKDRGLTANWSDLSRRHEEGNLVMDQRFGWLQLRDQSITSERPWSHRNSHPWESRDGFSVESLALDTLPVDGTTCTGFGGQLANTLDIIALKDANIFSDWQLLGWGCWAWWGYLGKSWRIFSETFATSLVQTNTIGFVAVISEVTIWIVAVEIVTFVFTVNAAQFSIVHFQMILTQSRATIARFGYALERE